MLSKGASALGNACSFTPTTQVTTDHGKRAIGDLKAGDVVLAYNPHTHKMEYQQVQHVWKHKDHDLVDLTLVSPKDAKGKELLHTTSEHPFLTQEKSFTPAGQLHVGMHVRKADGSWEVVEAVKVVNDVQVMYNLEVAQDHTFVVGDGEWVVHNVCSSTILRNNLGIARGVPYQAQHIIPCQLSCSGSSTHPLVSLAEELIIITLMKPGTVWHYRTIMHFQPGLIYRSITITILVTLFKSNVF